MNDGTNPPSAAHTTTRRQIITTIAIACCARIAPPSLWAESQEKSMNETPSTAANKTRTSLHQEIDLKAPPQRIYEVLLSSKDFAACTGAPAEIDPKAGGAFSMFGGMIVGRNIELVPGQRIVQAWRPADWPAGLYSLVRFELKPRGSETTVVLDHTSFPEGGYDHLSAGWHEHYWEPLKKFLA
jgi:activator of HSP90 ATPase